MPSQRKIFRICFDDDDFEVDQMHTVALCGHQFCVECMKKYVEAMLLEGRAPRCPHYQCESKPTLRSFASLLTPKLIKMWEQKIQEDSVPVLDRVYCPNPMCSALMSVSDLYKSSDGHMSCCFKCFKPFCINCKVPCHNNMSCGDYKRLCPNPTTNDMMLEALANHMMWRQCGKCQHMIERVVGCIKVTCRCGYSFCYTCGEEWKQSGCSHRREQFTICCLSLLIIVLIIFGVAIYINQKKSVL